MRDQTTKQATSSKTILHFIILLAAIVIPVGGLGFLYAQWRLNPLQIRIDEVQKKLPSSSTPTVSPTPIPTARQTPIPTARQTLIPTARQTPILTARQTPEQQSKLEEQLFNFQKERTDLEQKIMIGVIQLMGGLFVASTVYISWQNFKQTQKNVEVAQEKQITERFTQAINQLGTEAKEGEGDKIAIRLGGIYALERIAKDSEKDHWTIMEVLTAFIREKSPSSDREKLFDSDVEQSQKEQFPGITQDAQAALTVIGRREKREEPETLDLSGANLRDANLINARLSRANFASSKLSRANLNGADLTDANFHWGSLNGADLTGTDFTGAKLRGANLRGAKRDDRTKFDPKWELVYQLVNSDGIDNEGRKQIGMQILKNEDLSEANLSKLCFHETDLSETNFSGANFSEAILQYVNISGTNFSEANFSKATLQTISWHEESSSPQSFENSSRTSFSKANFSEAVLIRVDFGNADLTNAKFCKAAIEDGDLSKAKLEKTDFRGADLRKANLCGVSFRDIIVDEETMLEDKWRIVERLQRNYNFENREEEDLRGKDLRGANLSSVRLSGADLSGADLSGANLSKANLSGADLSGADLSGADLSKASLNKVNFRGTIINRETKIDDKWRLVHRLINEGGVNIHLRGKDLSYANLYGVDLRTANLSDVDLRGAIINDETKIDDKWRLVHRLINEGGVNEDLSGVDLSGAYLGFADFREANLRGANLKGTDLTRATFWDSDLKGNELAQAKEKAKQTIQAAKNWEEATYSPNIRTWLELPQES
jgi:hypothetical protein